MSFKLFNTLTGKREEFRPLKAGEVSMYNCGPTVYNYAHIGNLRAYVFADVLRRTLEYNGYKVRQVMNITDVGHLTSDGDDGDDKMIKALKREGKPFTFEAMQEIARKYESAFKEDLQALNIEMPHEMPRASEHIKEDIEIIQALLEKGIAYKASDGIYFDISKYPSYGTRGGFKLGELKEGARVAVNAEKKNPRDFSLWKFSTTDLGWDFLPYGKGFPGWHIECSAMSRKYLGQPFDIHTGGIDHIPTHHQNEIAQSEAAYDKPLANYWLHNEHLIIADGKMAKSGENFITLQTLKDRGIHPLAFRYYLLQAHYRSPLNFSWEALLAANAAYKGLLWSFWSFEDDGSGNNKYEDDFKKVMGEDMNTSEALAILWKLLKDPAVSNQDKHTTVVCFDRVLGLDIEKQSKMYTEVDVTGDEGAVVRKMFELREDARKAKDFKKSDVLRDQIQREGFEIMDTDFGPILRKKL